MNSGYLKIENSDTIILIQAHFASTIPHGNIEEQSLGQKDIVFVGPGLFDRVLEVFWCSE